MLYQLARLLQFVGLVLLPVGIAGNLARPKEFNVWFTLTVAGTGAICFILGYLLQQAVRKE